MVCQEIEGGGEDTLARVSYPPTSLVEDEFHFLMTCKAYQTERNIFFTKVNAFTVPFGLSRIDGGGEDTLTGVTCLTPTIVLTIFKK